MSTDWRERLLQMRAELESVADTVAAASETVELDQSKVGRLSRMDAMQGQAMAQASKERRKQQLQLINAALQRIDDDEFGYCQRCGESIDPRRLAFDPTALLCIDCASKAEAD
ncbi:MAG: TraR/DksA family transcriptional regulator [Woeseiaceae bacterium]|jgi:DnaK suppressor protein